MSLERIVLDPSGLDIDRAELPLEGALRVRPEGPDWGDAEIAAYMSEMARGEVPVDFRVPNRKITIPLMLHTEGAATFAEARTQLQQKIGLWQREGGWLMRELRDGTPVYLDIVNATLGMGGGGLQALQDVDNDVDLALEALPDFYGEDKAIADDFSTDTIADYTFDAGSGTLAVSGAQLVPSSTAEKRLFHNRDEYGDAQVTVKFTTGAALDQQASVMLKRLDANNYLQVRRYGSGADRRLQIRKLDVGNPTDLAEVTGLGALTASTSYWVRARIEGNLVTAEFWTSAPTPAGTPATTVTYTLAGANATKFGSGVQGDVGMILIPGGTDYRYDDFQVEPFTYRETTLPELVRVLDRVEGAWSARCSIKVNELDGDDRLGILWGLRSRHYSADATARLAYEAEALDPLDTAAIATLSGASGGGSNNVVQHTNLGTGWTPVNGTNIGGTDWLTHTGSYRVWVRARSADGTAVKLRFVYDVGDLVLPEENAPWQFPAASQLYLADLGQIRLDKVPTGDHRWQGQIQAKGAAGGEDVQIDRLYFQPLDDGAGKIAVTPSPSDGLVDYVARDEFNQSAGALNAKTAAVGGAWATSGVAGDFTVETTGKTAERSTTGEASPRFAVSGAAAMTAQAVQADFKQTGWVAPGTNNQLLGLLARWTDSSNYFRATIFPGEAPSTRGLVQVAKVVAGAATLLSAVSLPTPVVAGQAYTMQLLVDAAGRWLCWVFPKGTTPRLVASGQDTALATGGTLASGKPGFRDQNTPATAATRNVDNFGAWVPVQDAAIFANQSAELRTEGMFRKDAAGAASGPIVPIGDLPRLPPSGMEGRPCELFVLPTRGDFDQLPDTAIDDLGVQVAVRPSWLFAPG